MNTVTQLGTAITLWIVLGSGAGKASAIYSSFNDSAGGEDKVGKILSNVYAGQFVKSGLDYLNQNGIGAIRVDDSSDQVWSGEFTSFIARGRFAGNAQSFGYFSGSSGGEYVNLFDVAGTGYMVGKTSFLDPLFNPDSVMRWGRSGGQSAIWSSVQAENPSGQSDHMISYQLTGLAGPQYAGRETFVLFWEDQNLGDRDYNDMVIEISRIAMGPGASASTTMMATNPEPATALTGLLSIIGLTLATSRRRCN